MVRGSGCVSLFALQFAKMMECRVIATPSSDEKLQHLESPGADQLISSASKLLLWFGILARLAR
jgi:NADPH:quinone reductase-like Zn-dependent oxidoreductase